MSIPNFATVITQETLALVANLDMFRSGKMEGSDVYVTNATNLPQHHVPKIQLVTPAIVILGMMESNARNALLNSTFFHSLIVEVNQVSKIVKAFFSLVSIF